MSLDFPFSASSALEDVASILHNINVSILFGLNVMHFQHCTGHIMTGSFVGRGHQYKVLYCKLPTISKKLPSFPHKVRGLNH